MLKNSTRLLIILGGLVISLAHTITPVIKEGASNLKSAPFIKIGNGYYYIEPKQRVNWFTAFENCRQMDANLIALKTTEEWVAITQYLNSLSSGDNYWTSGTDLAKQGQHFWFATGKPINIHAWAPGQPDNHDKKEHCDHLLYNKGNPKVRQLNDAQCEAEMHYICQARDPYTVSFVVW